MIMIKTINIQNCIGFLLFLALTMSCTPGNKPDQTETYEMGTIGFDLDFLSKYQQTILLQGGLTKVTCRGDRKPGRIVE
jgi:hypothetical protein